MHNIPGLFLFSQVSLAADIVFDVELPGDGVSVSVFASDVAVGKPLPATVLYDSEGAEVKVTANVVGVVDGEAVVQVNAVRSLSVDSDEGNSLESTTNWKVINGSTDWTGRKGPTDEEEDVWIRFSLRQEGLMESTRPGRYHLDLILPESFNMLFVGHVMDEVGVAEPAVIREIPFALGEGLLAAGAGCSNQGREPQATFVLHPPGFGPPNAGDRPEMRAVVGLLDSGFGGKARYVDVGTCSFRTASGESLEYTFTVQRI